jgi:hypothetical protein
LDVPPTGDASNFVYNIVNGVVYDAIVAPDASVTNYATAQKYCATKNGTLAVADSHNSLEAIRGAMAAHINLYNYQMPNYLVGNNNTIIFKK